MNIDERSREELLAENEELRYRLEEAEETLETIRSGGVDALVISGPEGAQIFTLQGAEHPYRVLVESMHEGAATLSPDGDILYCNRRLAAMLRMPLEKLFGKSLASFVAPQDRQRLGQCLGSCSEDSDLKEISLIPVQGDPIPVLVSCCCLDLPENKAVSIILADISMQKLAEARLREVQIQSRLAHERQRGEEALKKLNEELEQRVADRTAELREKDRILLMQGRQAAMGEMIGNIAHQWRQPLNVLGLLVQEIPFSVSVGEVDQAYLDRAAQKAMALIDHMSLTIDDFRNFFRPDKEKVHFKVKAEVEKILSLVEESLKAQKIRVSFETHADPVAYGYPNEFSQAMLNIVINARDALVERAVPNPAVTISASAEGNKAVILIADNAGGIAEDIIDKVFDPYFTTKGPQNGTGVGLFMSKTIIEKNMSGRLVARNIGDGAEFRVEVGP